MQLIIEREALLKELSRVAGVVESRTTIPILAHIRLDAVAEHLLIRGTDLDIEIEAPCAADVSAQGVTTVEAKTFAAIVKKMPEGAQIGLTLDDARHRLKIVAGRVRFELPVLDAEDFPSLDRGGGGHEFTLDAGELRQLIAPTIFAVSRDETRYMLNGVFFHQIGEELAACATNGHQLARRKGVPLPAGADGMPSVILPRKLVGELLRSLPGEGEIALEVSPQRIVVTSGEMRIVSKLIDGTYPDYNRVVPKGHPSGLRINRERLIKAVERVRVVAGDKETAVNLIVKADALHLACRSPERGTAFDECEAVLGPTAEKTTIGVNGGYLLDILASFEAEEIGIDYADPSAPLLIKVIGSEDQICVLMPMRTADIIEERVAA
ncbi:MAG: DNA polymerase III subunit beta [Pseudomonadota bacterium]|nr:DNA polymerase III subunit beta [Pseudomonadota bacterium]